MKARKPRSVGTSLRTVLPFVAAALFGILATAANARSDALQERLDRVHAQAQLQDLGELTERTERICTHLLEWKCPVSESRREELRMAVAVDAAMAKTNVARIPFGEEQAAAALSFLTDCTVLSSQNGSVLTQYAQTLLIGLEEALSQAEKGEAVFYSIPAYPQSQAASVRSFDPEHDEIGTHDARKCATEYLGNMISLRRVACADDAPYYRFYCQNGFCDMRKSDGRLLRMAVYKIPHGEERSRGVLQAALLDFFNRQHLRDPICDRSDIRHGILTGTYYENNVTVYVGISASTAKIASYDRCALPLRENLMPASSLARMTGEEEAHLRTMPNGQAVYCSTFRDGTVGGEILRNAENGSVIRIRFRFYSTPEITGKPAQATLADVP